MRPGRTNSKTTCWQSSSGETHINRITLIAGFGAVAAIQPLAARAQTTTKLRIATTTDDAAAEPVYAQELGYFRAAGLDVDLQVLANGGEILSSVTSGAIDIGSANLLSAVTAFRKGMPLRIVAPAAFYDGTVPQVALLVANSSPLRTAKDLEGKTVATNPIRGISSISTEMWMKKNGADPSTLHWVEMPRGAMGPALQQGHVDAATMTEPFIALNKPATRILAAPYSAVAPRFVTVVFSATDQWSKANPDLVRRFADVMQRTAKWANTNQAASGAILARQAKMEPSLVAQMTRVKYEENLTATEIQPCIELAAQGNLIDAAFPAQEMIYRRS
jgi:NitT/TauT family transport system substrate-binding protein